MDTKSLLIGIISFIAGGLLVSIAAVTINKPALDTSQTTMNEMVESLKGKTGDEYDKAFITGMIEHHQTAVDMARLSATNAKHSEIKKLSTDIISAQESEIFQMKQWQQQWGYGSAQPMNH